MTIDEPLAESDQATAQAEPSGADVYIIDTSVALKWFVQEAGSDEARRYLRASLIRRAPDLLPIECSHVLAKRTRVMDPAQRITAEEARKVAEAFRVDSPIQYDPCMPLLRLGMALAIELVASVYDCLFLALAIELDCQVVTADRKLPGQDPGQPPHPRTADGTWMGLEVRFARFCRKDWRMLACGPIFD